jgi:uncharacterized protein (TIGR03435 family)
MVWGRGGKAPTASKCRLWPVPGFPTALRQQLGLKLEPEKGPVDVYVIDHLEKVTGN